MSEGISRLAVLLVVAAAGWAVGRCSVLINLRIQWRLARTSLSAAGDPLVEIAVALLWLVSFPPDGVTFRWAALAVLVVPLVQVAVTNLRSGYISTIVASAGILAGTLLAPTVYSDQWWTGIVGASLAAAAFTALYVYGRITTKGQEPIQRGVITGAVLVGAVAGPHVIAALVAGVILNGALAVILMIRGRAHSRESRVPFVASLCVTGIAALMWP